MEFDWDKIKQDDRFMREGTSWKRMLPQQPPTIELWLRPRDAGEERGAISSSFKFSPTAEGKMIGETWDNVRFDEAQPSCLRTRTFPRSSGASIRQQITVAISVEVQPLDGEEDYQTSSGLLLDIPYYLDLSTGSPF